jgi:hypothetical protein
LAKVLLENASDAAKVAIINDDKDDVKVPNEGEGQYYIFILDDIN